MKRLAADVAQDEFSGSLVGNQHRAEFAVLLEDLHLGRLDVLGAARRCRLCQRLLFGRRGTVSCQPAVSERASDDENGDNIQAGVNDFALVRGSGSGVYLRGGSLLSNVGALARSEEHTSELQSLMRISYDVFCLKKKRDNTRRY